MFERLSKAGDGKKIKTSWSYYRHSENSRNVNFQKVNLVQRKDLRIEIHITAESTFVENEAFNCLSRQGYNLLWEPYEYGNLCWQLVAAQGLAVAEVPITLGGLDLSEQGEEFVTHAVERALSEVRGLPG